MQAVGFELGSRGAGWHFYHWVKYGIGIVTVMYIHKEHNVEGGLSPLDLY